MGSEPHRTHLAGEPWKGHGVSSQGPSSAPWALPRMDPTCSLQGTLSSCPLRAPVHPPLCRPQPHTVAPNHVKRTETKGRGTEVPSTPVLQDGMALAFDVQQAFPSRLTALASLQRHWGPRDLFPSRWEPTVVPHPCQDPQSSLTVTCLENHRALERPVAGAPWRAASPGAPPC